MLHEKNLLPEHQAYFMSDTKPEFELYDINKDPDLNDIENMISEKRKRFREMVSL